jgi:hypothetical protein
MTERERLIHKLTISGELTQLYRNGIVTSTVLMYRDIYNDLKTEVTIKKVDKFQAIHNIADRYGVSVRTVYRAETFFKQ